MASTTETTLSGADSGAGAAKSAAAGTPRPASAC